MSATVRHLNPEGMHRSPAFSQAVLVEAPARTLYIGGQNGVGADGKVVREDDLAAQTEQIYKNLATILEAAGGTLHDIVKWTIYVVQGLDIRPALGVFRRAWGEGVPPPAITVVTVAGFANPTFLAEIDAIAVIGRGARDGA